MLKIIKSRLLGGIFLLIVALFLVALGLVLTVTVVFSVIGIPVLIIGLALLIISIFSMFFGTLSDLVSLVKMPFRIKEKAEKHPKKIIDLKKEGNVYRKAD